MNKQTTFYKFGHRDQGYLSDKYIRELHNEVPFDIELVGSNNKKVKAHRFVVMMFSKYFRNLFKDGGNSYQNGMVIVPISGFSHQFLEKLIELLYQCQVSVPSSMAQPFSKLLLTLQIEGILPNGDYKPPDFKRPLPPQNNPMGRGPSPQQLQQKMPTAIQVMQTPVQLNRRVSMVINSVPQKRAKPTINPNMPLNFTANRSLPVSQIKSSVVQKITNQVKIQPKPTRSSIDNQTVNSNSENSRQNSGSILEQMQKVSEASNGSNHFTSDDNGKLADFSGNEENEKPDLYHDVDIESDDTYKDFFEDIELNFP